jgi:hypothetical protein
MLAMAGMKMSQQLKICGHHQSQLYNDSYVHLDGAPSFIP